MKASQNTQVIRFGGFTANLHSGEVFNDGAKIRLQEQPFKILSMLLERPGELVTREELRARLWPDDTFVDFDHSINVAIAKIREALGDFSERPRFVETVGRRGYRFLATIEGTTSLLPALQGSSAGLQPKRHSVGRERERVALALAFESAATGSGLLVCVAGEPGIGKTTLVQDFLSDLQASRKAFSLAVGRCSQRLAGEEAYLPFLEALESLVQSGGNGAAHKLRTLAPSWYAQVFPLSKSDPSDARLQEYVGSTTQERMKRELAAFICEITRQVPLVLFFDDVHWTDPSTVDLLTYLGTKFDSTRILVIVTYRPAELILLKHPFLEVKRELQAHNV